jgi:hypothetical protein
MEGEPNVQRHSEFEPLPVLPEWPGNEEAKTHDFKAGFEQVEEGVWTKFEAPLSVEDQPQFYFPPSFKYYLKDDAQWMRPEEYIREILYEEEVQRRKREKRREIRLRKSTRKTLIMSMATPQTNEEV